MPCRVSVDEVCKLHDRNIISRPEARALLRVAGVILKEEST